MAEATQEQEDAWAAEFQVSAAQIRDAVRAVGPDKGDVEMYLKGSRSSSNEDVARAGGA